MNVAVGANQLELQSENKNWQFVAMMFNAKNIMKLLFSINPSIWTHTGNQLLEIQAMFVRTQTLLPGVPEFCFLKSDDLNKFKAFEKFSSKETL